MGKMNNTRVKKNPLNDKNTSTTPENEFFA